MARFEAVLAPDFSIVTPSGEVWDRRTTLDGVGAAAGHTDTLTITTSDHRLLLEQGRSSSRPTSST